MWVSATLQSQINCYTSTLADSLDLADYQKGTYQKSQPLDQGLPVSTFSLFSLFTFDLDWLLKVRFGLEFPVHRNHSAMIGITGISVEAY